MKESQLWEDDPPRYVPGEVRRALDRDLKAARDAGRDFLETEVAAVRRQANDLDRLERMLSLDGKAKTWDYNPKTTAAQAYLEAVRRLFGRDDDADGLARLFAELDDDERAAAARHTTEPGPPD